MTKAIVNIVISKAIVEAVIKTVNRPCLLYLPIPLETPQAHIRNHKIFFLYYQFLFSLFSDFAVVKFQICFHKYK